MKTRSVATAAAMALSLMALSIPNVAADAPTSVVIHLIPNPFPSPSCNPYQCGAWDLSSQGFVDRGTERSLDGDVAPPNRNPFTAGPLFETFQLTSATGNGSFIIHAEERLVGTFPNISQVGVWQIDAGTGVYADASGHGDVSLSVNPIVLNLTGVISKVGSG